MYFPLFSHKFFQFCIIMQSCFYTHLSIFTAIELEEFLEKYAATDSVPAGLVFAILAALIECRQILLRHNIPFAVGECVSQS